MWDPASLQGFRDAGGRFGRRPVSFPLTHERIRFFAEFREDILRAQFEDERLPEDDEEVLARLSPDDPDQCFRRYEYLLGAWGAWERGYRGRDEEAGNASELILSREPVYVSVAGRRIPVYPRSRAAIIRMARHEQARTAVGAKIDWLEERAAELDAHRAAGVLGPFRAWLAHRAIATLTTRAGKEWEYQAMGVLANALTRSGRAARPEELPDICASLLSGHERRQLGERAGEWWLEISLGDEQQILGALVEHVDRYRRASEGRRNKAPAKSGGKREDHGFGVVLRLIEGRVGVPPMALEDADLFQAVEAFELGQSGSDERAIDRAVA